MKKTPVGVLCMTMAVGVSAQTAENVEAEVYAALANAPTTATDALLYAGSYQIVDSPDGMVFANVATPPVPGNLGLTEEGAPVLFLDIFKALDNEAVKEANVVMKVPTALWESAKTTGRYTTQNPLHLLGTAVVGLAAYEAGTGNVSDFINDTFYSGGGGGGDSASTIRPRIVATENAIVIVQDADQRGTIPVDITARGNASVTIDYQQAGSER